MRYFLIFIFLFSFYFLFSEVDKLTFEPHESMILNDTINPITSDFILGVDSYDKYRAETTIKYLLQFYDEYKQKCYQDSFKVEEIKGIDYNMRWVTTWKHREPTFDGFMKFLKENK